MKKAQELIDKANELKDQAPCKICKDKQMESCVCWNPEPPQAPEKKCAKCGKDTGKYRFHIGKKVFCDRSCAFPAQPSKPTGVEEAKKLLNKYKNIMSKDAHSDNHCRLTCDYVRPLLSAQKAVTEAEVRSLPMGVDEWIAHGKKYGYMDYLTNLTIKPE